MAGSPAPYRDGSPALNKPNMPKPRKYELTRFPHFAWRLSRRDGVWYADGRSNAINAGRHSLGTRDKAEALHLLARLDLDRAIHFHLAAAEEIKAEPHGDLDLLDGRLLYEEYIGRPRITGGVKSSTKKRYRTVFDKFLQFTPKQGITAWNQVNTDVLNAYASYLEKQNYAQKSLLNELTTLKQAVRWLIDAGHLEGCEPIKLPLRKVESQRAYCYRPAEVTAMIMHCGTKAELAWLGAVIVVLACTGMRIDELVNLKWLDIDFDNERVTLADESGRGAGDGPRRTLKGGRSRWFPIHPDLLVVLKRIPKTDDYVFHGPRQGRLKADTVRRILVREVLKPLASLFPPPTHGGQSFVDGRLHSFRHYFVSMCAARNLSERMVMEWVGHADSAMVRYYYHLHDEEARHQMQSLDLLGGAGGRSVGEVSKVSS